MLVLDEVRKSYGSFEAVRGVSFRVQTGEILGLLGPNGAGKTTIMRILTGYHYPGSGTVSIDGRDFQDDSAQLRNRIGYLPENAPVYPELTVAEYLAFQAGVRIAQGPSRKAAMERAVTRCGLEGVYNRPIGELSKGYRQRVGLAQAIIHDPDIMVLDEPTTGLDPNQIQEIRQLILELGQAKTIILSTHIMQEVEALCQRVLILNEGRIVAEGDTGTIGRELRGDESYFIRFARIDAAGLRALSALPRVNRLEEKDGGIELSLSPGEQDGGELLFTWAVERGLVLRQLSPRKLSLEDIFRELTREGRQ